MDKPSFFISIADLIILFFFGLLLCYYDSYVLPISGSVEFLISFTTALFLGSFGPSMDEVFEWIIFFSLGVITMHFYPAALTAYETQTLPLQEITEAGRVGGLYTAQLLTAWVAGIPVGYLFFKLTDSKYYRHNSF